MTSKARLPYLRYVHICKSEVCFLPSPKSVEDTLGTYLWHEGGKWLRRLWPCGRCSTTSFDLGPKSGSLCRPSQVGFLAHPPERVFYSSSQRPLQPGDPSSTPERYTRRFLCAPLQTNTRSVHVTGAAASQVVCAVRMRLPLSPAPHVSRSSI
jgi:hypothetical protein